MKTSQVINIKDGLPYDVYIGRPSVYGNPYTHIKDRKTKAGFIVKTREEAIKKYKEHLLGSPELLEKIEELRGKILGCWCHPKKCHGHIIIEILNTQRLF